MIKIENLSFYYGEKKALNSVSFDVKPGEIFAMLGPNGGGKSTLFKIISTLMQPKSGKVLINGLDVTLSQHAIRSSLGVVFQNPSLDLRLTVQENLKHQGHLYGLQGKDLKDRIATSVKNFGLAGRENEKIETLSGGFRRRVEVARAFMHRPKILLLDEPTTGLDPAVRLDVWNLLIEMRKEFGVTILLTTHLMDEADKCDRVAILDRGKLLTIGTPEQLKNKIAGDVIELKTKQADELALKIKNKFNFKVLALNGLVKIEKNEGHRFLAELIESFPGEITEVAMRKPSLEDVFMQETGRKFDYES